MGLTLALGVPLQVASGEGEGKSKGEAGGDLGQQLVTGPPNLLQVE